MEYFTFAAVPPGTYSLSVTKDGFSTWEAKSVVLKLRRQSATFGN